MSDFERLLRSSLEEAGSSFEPKDAAAARQRFLEARRRRRLTVFVSGIALAGAAVAVVLFVVSSGVKPTLNDVDIAASDPAVVASIPIGLSPSGVTVDDDGVVWVANVEGPSVARYAPGDEEVQSIPVPAPPDDVAATDLFVFTTDHSSKPAGELFGSGTVIDRAGARLVEGKTLDDIPSGARAQYFDGTLTEGPGAELGHLDIAASGDALWVTSDKEAGVALNLDDGQVEIFPEVPPTSDVATLDGHGFALDAGGHALYRLDPGDSPNVRTFPLPADVVLTESGNLDMTGGLGAIWIVQEGVLYRIDPNSGELTGTLELDGGDYAAVATGEGYVWILVGSTGEAGGGKLIKVDPDTAEVVGAPLELTGKLVDVAAGGGSVWVTSRSPDALLRIAPSGGDVEPGPDETEGPVRGAGVEMAFAYSADGDIYVAYEDGTNARLTDTPAMETEPEFGFRGLFFEREDGGSGESLIVRHSFETGREKVIANGSSPAFSPGGILAWWEPAKGQQGPVIHTARVGTDGSIKDGGSAFDAGEAFSELRALEWNEDGASLFYQALGDRWVTVQAQVPADDSGPPTPFVLDGLNDQPPGSTLAQPTHATPDGLEVASVCCSEVEGDAYSEVSVAAVDLTEGGPTFRSLTQPVDGLLADPDVVLLGGAHELAYVDGAWDVFSGVRSWILSDGTAVYLVDEDGGVLPLAGEGDESILGAAGSFGGFDLNPHLEGDLGI